MKIKTRIFVAALCIIVIGCSGPIEDDSQTPNKNSIQGSTDLQFPNESWSLTLFKDRAEVSKYIIYLEEDSYFRFYVYSYFDGESVFMELKGSFNEPIEPFVFSNGKTGRPNGICLIISRLDYELGSSESHTFCDDMIDQNTEVDRILNLLDTALEVGEPESEQFKESRTMYEWQKPSELVEDLN